MKLRLLTLEGLFAGLLSSCSPSSPTLPPTDQVLLFIDTDAPLVDSARSNDRLAPLPLFDRLRLDVYACGDATRCKPTSRDLDVDATLMRSETGVSFGIVPAEGQTALVRARLFLSGGIGNGEPPSDVTIDVTAFMPEVAGLGIVEATLFLPTDQVGVPASDVSRPVPTIAGRPRPSAVGTWPSAERVDCIAPDDGTGSLADEVCIPGGAYWLGSGVLKDFRLFLDPAADARRLVVLKPFYFDAHEVTVGDLRAHGLSTPNLWSGETAGTSAADWCTFTRAPGPHEDLPVNCIARSTALSYCTSLGKTFPTEAQFEYVAGGLQGALWPWGNEAPTCGDAVLAHAYGLPEPDDLFRSSDCLDTAPVEGPLPVGTAKRDFVEVGGAHGGKVFDLVGNVSENMLDLFQFRSDACWSRPGIYFDPVCLEPGTGAPGVTMKGGNFWWSRALSFSVLRAAVLPAYTADPLFGFRCARAGL